MPDYEGREILARAVVHYRATILAIKNRQIIGCVVGSIERYPWMATPLPTHSPRPVEICKAFMASLATKTGYKSMGIKSGTPVYVTKLIATRHDCRGVGLASKLFDEAIRSSSNLSFNINKGSDLARRISANLLTSTRPTHSFIKCARSETFPRSIASSLTTLPLTAHAHSPTLTQSINLQFTLLKKLKSKIQVMPLSTQCSDEAAPSVQLHFCGTRFLVASAPEHILEFKLNFDPL